jgi:C4-dicarboxylate-specific signal transduction histidine kinase
MGNYESAQKILLELLAVRVEPVAVRTLFRIGRLRRNYSAVEEFLSRNFHVVKEKDFNILYELFYYYESKNDFDSMQNVIRTLNRGFSTNLPVLRTARNFCIRVGMLEEAKALETRIADLYRRRYGSDEEKYTAAVTESETELASKVQDLYSQLEHHKQLVAISDLTTGISHELGQPITNIRYAIQFHQRIFSKGIVLEKLNKLFESILEETERMGGLIRRLAPLTSSKSVVEHFDVVGRIGRRLEAELPRLSEGNIKYSLLPERDIIIQGDPVKFDQLISNLVLNAIDAIVEKGDKRGGIIDIKVESSSSEIRIFFADSGVGIPVVNRNKIFDPFFSTKSPGKGEGLGLFIVWNIIKMIGGRISVDVKYKGGARFIMTLPRNYVDPRKDLS